MWSDTFKSRLQGRTLEPIIIIDVGMATGAAFGFPGRGVTTDRSFTSDIRYAVGTAGVHGRYLLADLKMSRYSVKIRDWTVGGGGFSFSVISKEPLSGPRWPFQPARGLPVRVRMGFDGFDASDFQTVAWGVVKSITRRGDTWTVDCGSILDAIRSKFRDMSVPFSNIGKTTDIRSPGWNAGAGGDLPIDDDIFTDEYIDSAYGSAAPGVAKIDSPGSGIPPWYFQFSGVTGSTGSYLLTQHGTNDWFGRTTSGTYAYPAGTTVTLLAGVAGAPKPWDLYFSLLTGSGNFNMPTTWHMGIRSGIVSRADIESLANHPSSESWPSMRWSPMADAPIDDLFSWITTGLGELDMFPIGREGQISLNIAPNRLALQSYDVLRGVITNDHIASIDGHELFHPDARVQYKAIREAKRYTTALGTIEYTMEPAAEINSTPWGAAVTKQLANGSVVATTDNIEISSKMAIPRESTLPNTDTTDVIRRTGIWFSMIPEEVKLTLSGLRWAHLALGDVVGIQTDYLYSRRYSYADDSLPAGITGMVTAIEVDWLRGQVRLTVATMLLREPKS